MFKNLVKGFYSWIYFLVQPILVYPPGRIVGKEFHSMPRIAIIEFLKNWKSHLHGKVLDVGVGTWSYPRLLLQDVCEYTSTDCFEHPNIDVVSNIIKLSDVFSEGQYDFILCTDVLEHVDKPWLAVKQLYFVLKPGGYLLLTTPFNFHLHANQTVKDYWRFTDDGLRQLLVEEAGFQEVVLKINGHPKFPFSFTVAARK